VVLTVPAAMPDLRALAALADEIGTPLGFGTAAQAKAELDQLAGWDGDRAGVPTVAAVPADESAKLATWRLLIDDSRGNDGEPYLLATARRPVARISANAAASAGVADGDPLVVSTAAGSVELPVAITAGMPDNVVWLPTNSPGSHVRRALCADHGSSVTISSGGAD
jgi:NADH-quinone oxidoreductase subunit G